MTKKCELSDTIMENNPSDSGGSSKTSDSSLRPPHLCRSLSSPGEGRCYPSCEGLHRPRSLMESLLLAKMEAASRPLLFRMDSTDSASSFGSVSSSNLGSDMCRCDDCMLGIADHLAGDESPGRRKVLLC